MQEEELPPFDWILSEDETWTEDVDITRSLLVQRGATLTVAAGVTVRIESGRPFQVEGGLVLAGTAEAPVAFETFGSLDGLNELKWMGEPGLSTLQHFNLQDVALVVDGDGLSGIQDCTVTGEAVTIRNVQDFLVSRCDFAPGRLWEVAALAGSSVSNLTVEDAQFTDANVGVEFNSSQEGGNLVVRDTDFTEIGTALRVGANRGDNYVVDIDRVTIEDADSDAIHANGASIDLQEVVLLGVRGDGIVAGTNTSLTADTVHLEDISRSGISSHGSNVAVSNAVFTRIGYFGLYTESPAQIADVVMSDVARGVYSASGALTVERADLSNSGFYGIYSSDTEAMVTVRDSVIADVGASCIVAEGGLLVDATEIHRCVGSGVHAYKESTVTDSTILDVTGFGVRAGQNTTLEQTDIERSGGACLHVSEGDVQMDGGTLLACGGDGIYSGGSVAITDVTIDAAIGDGVDARGPEVTLTDSQVLNPLQSGVYGAAATVTVSGTTIEGAGAYGIRADAMALESSSVIGAALTGLYIESELTSTISRSEIRDNGIFGVYGVVHEGNGIDIVDSNLTGNMGIAVFRARSVMSSFIADNNGETGVDSTWGGVLDGLLETQSDQIRYLDAVSDPQTMAIEDAGAP